MKNSRAISFSDECAYLVFVVATLVNASLNFGISDSSSVTSEMMASFSIRCAYLSNSFINFCGSSFEGVACEFDEVESIVTDYTPCIQQIKRDRFLLVLTRIFNKKRGYFNSQ